MIKSVYKKNNKGTTGCGSLHLLAIQDEQEGGREGNNTLKSQLNRS